MPEGEREKREGIIARVDAMSNPLRVAITSVLTQQSKSAAEVAKELDEPVDRIRYQLRQLISAGTVQVSRRQRRRGVVEQFYVGKDDAMVFDTEELELVPTVKRRKMAITFLRVSFREALLALSSGSMIERGGTMTVRTPLLVDEQGWAEIAQIHREAFNRIQELKADSARRIATAGEATVSATSVMLFFENPPAS